MLELIGERDRRALAGGGTANLYKPDSILAQKFVGLQRRTYQWNAVAKVQSLVDFSDHDGEALLPTGACTSYVLTFSMRANIV